MFIQQAQGLSSSSHWQTWKGDLELLDFRGSVGQGFIQRDCEIIRTQSSPCCCPKQWHLQFATPSHPASPPSRGQTKATGTRLVSALPTGLMKCGMLIRSLPKLEQLSSLG